MGIYRKNLTLVENAEPAVIAAQLAEISGLPIETEIDVEGIDLDLIRPMSMQLARDQGLLPIRLDEERGVILVGISSLKSLSGLDDLRLLLGKPVRPVLVPSDILTDAIHKVYDIASESASAVLEGVDESVGDDLLLEDADLLDDPNQAPIIRFVNALLSQAIKERSSDIHIEPFEKDLVVRFRVDGVLYETHRPPYRLKSSIVARIKIMAGLNIAEKRLPQDGRIRRRMAGREIDLRVSTLPVRHGERVVMRILEKGEVLSIDTIMQGAICEDFRRLIHKPHGILLVSGPTGSGKSTTLYSAVTEINTPDKNILTIEDPVEYELAGIGQVQVNTKIDLTFATALRSFLRQDPDVILVGEIRDSITAEHAVQASLTGHLVFSTVHTNDAAGAFPRLIDMGVEPFLVASSLLGIVAQRLVRKLCVSCREAYTPTDTELADLGIRRADLTGVVYRAIGCEECNKHGYRGRIGIFELLEATEEIKQLVIQNADAGTIKKSAVESGMTTLRENGVSQVMLGRTTFDEVLRVTREDGDE
jgi:general secretion pathway protein E